eukprot:3253711-Prorocentrum_lima.AAC.1
MVALPDLPPARGHALNMIRPDQQTRHSHDHARCSNNKSSTALAIHKILPRCCQCDKHEHT